MEVSAKYAAFISYAHADEPMARRIHNALETYRLPNAFDQDAKEKLKPIFRDVTELTAHHSLSEKIQDAVRTSRFLIILCSCLLYTSPSPRDGLLSRMPSSA